MAFSRRLHALSQGLERTVDALRSRLKEHSGGFGPLELLAYRGHAGPWGLVLRGRVLEERGLRPAVEGDTAWENLLATYRRFETIEVARARVQLEVGGEVHETVTDSGGYFLFRLPDAEVSPTPSGWAELPVIVPEGQEGIPRTASVGLVRVPSPDACYGVISDVDDTILKTGATSLLSVVRHTLLHNARTRRAFRGVSELYRAFEAGVAPSGPNPLFYVSSSPWNLYDLLADFMELRRIPAGPLFLQDLSLEERTRGAPKHTQHKLGMIREILEVHSDLPFVLVGDSGQQDPEVYREAARLWPDRIRSIYIREVSTEARDQQVRAMAADVSRQGVEMVLARSSLEVAGHAAAGGLISEDAVDLVRSAGRHRDES